MGKERIYWDDQDRGELVKRVAELMFRHPGKSYLDGLRTAQTELLSADRRRKVLSLMALPWLQPAVDVEIKRLRDSEKVEQHLVEEVIIQQTQLADIPTDELMGELLRRVLSNGGSGVIDRIANAAVTAVKYELPHVVAKLREKTDTVAKERLRRVLILGLLPDQQQEIRRRFDSCFELSFLEGRGLRCTAPEGAEPRQGAGDEEVRLAHAPEHAARGARQLQHRAGRYHGAVGGAGEVFLLAGLTVESGGDGGAARRRAAVGGTRKTRKRVRAYVYVRTPARTYARTPTHAYTNLWQATYHGFPCTGVAITMVWV